MLRFLTIGLIVVTLAAGVAVAGLERVVPAEATAGGKYTGLLRVVPAPGDEATFGKCADRGYHETSSWAGQENLPAGYWVYVAPNWYIWKQQTAIKPAADDMVGKQVTVYLDNGTPVKGQLVEQTTEYVVLLLADQAKKKLIYKAKITSIEWPAGPIEAAPRDARLMPEHFFPSRYDRDGLVVPGDMTNKWNTR
jgi:sRNA-binding regulator protein Hfq